MVLDLFDSPPPTACLETALAGMLILNTDCWVLFSKTNPVITIKPTKGV